jgi:hypothetical protein
MHTNANKLFLIIFPSIRKKFKNIFVDCSRKNFNKQRQALDLTLIQKKHTKRSFFNQLRMGIIQVQRYFYLSFSQIHMINGTLPFICLILRAFAKSNQA